jgi:hypothetical protein
MALTDTEIKKAKPKEKAYRMSDSGGMYLWVTSSGGKLWQRAYRYEHKESSCPWVGIQRYLWRLPGSATVKAGSC